MADDGEYGGDYNYGADYGGDYGGEEGGGEEYTGDYNYGEYNENDYLETGEEGQEAGGEEESPETKMENWFYDAKEKFESDPNAAVEGFAEVIRIEQEELSADDRPHAKGFQATKWLVKTYHALGKGKEAKQTFQTLVKNYDKMLLEKENAINKLLDAVTDNEFISDFFQLILDKFKKAGSSKASLRFELKQAKVLWKQKEWEKLGPILEGLHVACKNADGSDDLSKGNQLLEIYALRVSRATEKNDVKEQKQLYQAALPVIQKALGYPRMTGIIYECGGKMELREGHYEEARSAFFEAFKSFDEGNAVPECQSCLKNLVLANMLSGSNIDPFQDRRAKAHENHPHIALMKETLVNFQALDLKAYTASEAKVKKTINDRWINDYLPHARRKLQKLMFLHLVKPYTTLRLSFVEKHLDLKTEACEELIVELVLDAEIDISIDQIGRILHVNRSLGSEYNRKYSACQAWTTQLGSLTRNILGKVN